MIPCLWCSTVDVLTKKGIFSALLSNSIRKVHPVDLILRDVYAAVKLLNDLGALSASMDDRVHHAVQATVTRMLLHLRSISSFLLTLTPSSEFRSSETGECMELSKMAKMTSTHILNKEVLQLYAGKTISCVCITGRHPCNINNQQLACLLQ